MKSANTKQQKHNVLTSARGGGGGGGVMTMVALTAASVAAALAVALAVLPAVTAVIVVIALQSFWCGGGGNGRGSGNSSRCRRRRRRSTRLEVQSSPLLGACRVWHHWPSELGVDFYALFRARPAVWIQIASTFSCAEARTTSEKKAWASKGTSRQFGNP